MSRAVPGGRALAILAVGFAMVGCVPLSASATGPLPTPNGIAASATPTGTPARSVEPQATPTPTPVPEPTATPDPSLLELQATSCDGGVLLDWSASLDPSFHHYTALRSPQREIEPFYPPIAPAVDWGDTYATDRFVTSGVDASIIPSEARWFYRVMAYDAAGAVIGASPVRSAQLHPTDDLGAVRAAPAEAGSTRLSWNAYGGFSRCFSSYRITFGLGGSPTTVLAVVSDQATAELRTDALHPGTTYTLRVQAVRATPLGSFVVGESQVATYTVP